jgi:glucokinase
MTGAVGNAPARRIGIDVGGTKDLGVAVGPDGTIVAEEQRQTPRGADSLAPLLDVLVGLSESLGYSASPGSTLGIGVPGLVTRGGVLRAAPNLDGVANFEVGRIISERLGGDVRVDNDGTCAAVAEWKLGAAEGVDNMILVTLGTGIGGGVVANGAVVRGHNGFAGEFGHMVVDPNGPPCPCGRRGCWERYASGSGLAMLARNAAVGNGLQRVVRDAGGDPQAVRGEHVQSAAREGDPEALAVIDEFGRWVALGLSNLTNALDPETIILGGGLADGADLYLDPIKKWFPELLYRADLRPLPDVKFAEWGPLAGAVGAALLPTLFHPPNGQRPALDRSGLDL